MTPNPFGIPHGQPFGIPASNAAPAQQQQPGGFWVPIATPVASAQTVPGGPTYDRLPAYPPMHIHKSDCYYVPRFYGFRFGGNGVTAGTQPPLNLPFTKDTQIFARNASVFLADNTDLPVGRTPLSCAQIKMSRSASANADYIDTMAGSLLPSAECLYGTGGLPGFFIGNALAISNGSYLLIECATLLNNIQVDITLAVLEQWPQTHVPI
jgi:hypothetical protein